MDDLFEELNRHSNATSSDQRNSDFQNNASSSQEPQNEDSTQDASKSTSNVADADSSTNKNSASSRMKDMTAIKLILSEMGVTQYEPEVVECLLEFSYKYMHNVLEDAKLYSKHAKKNEVDVGDVKLALQLRAGQDMVQPVPKELIAELAKKKNATPLPQIKSNAGLKLPIDRYCLTQPNYKLKSSSTRSNISESNKPYSKMRHQTPDPIHGYQSMPFGAGGVRGRPLPMQTMMQHHQQQSQTPDPRLGSYQNVSFPSSSPASAVRAKAPMQMQSMMQPQPHPRMAQAAYQNPGINLSSRPPKPLQMQQQQQQQSMMSQQLPQQVSPQGFGSPLVQVASASSVGTSYGYTNSPAGPRPPPN